MSRESLLDEAIVKAKEAEDWQLVMWLRMARGGENAAKWYTTKLNQLSDENTKLREQVLQLQLDWESEREYADQMEAKEKKAVAENDKLRKLLSQALAARELKTFFEYFEPHSFWASWCEDVHEMGIEVGE